MTGQSKWDVLSHTVSLTTWDDLSHLVQPYED